MIRRFKTIEAKIAGWLLIWVAVLVVVAGFVFYVAAMSKVTELYVENVHNRMLINYEYIRRVLSDVYVQVTNNVDYIEQTLDQPEGQKDIMKRIVSNGNRVHSCGMNFTVTIIPRRASAIVPSLGGILRIPRRYSQRKKATTISTIWKTTGSPAPSRATQPSGANPSTTATTTRRPSQPIWCPSTMPQAARWLCLVPMWHSVG